MYQIVRRQQFSDSTFLWDVHAPDVARAAKPGHFVMLRLKEGAERISLTVADFDVDRRPGNYLVPHRVLLRRRRRAPGSGESAPAGHPARESSLFVLFGEGKGLFAGIARVAALPRARGRGARACRPIAHRAGASQGE